jgi:CIC family chloride channel protein
LPEGRNRKEENGAAQPPPTKTDQRCGFFRSHGRHSPRMSKLVGDEHLLLSLVAALIGMLSGYAAVGFRWLINVISSFSMFHRISSAAADPQFNINGWLILLVPAAGGLLVGLLVKFLAPEAKGHGVPEVMESVTKKHGIIRPRLVVVKALASALCIGTGGSVGREGPIVHVGSALGSSIGQLLKIRGNVLKVAVGCGAAGGISATFNTPLSGVLFAVELLLLEFKTRSFVPLVISSVFATIISRIYLGHSPAFVVPPYSFVNPVELLFYLGLGLIAALVAVAEIKTLYRAEDFFDKLRIPDWTKPVLGGLIIGAIALAFPRILGIGYPSVDAALSENLALSALLSLAIVKILALSVTIGSGGSGGVFAPTLFIGSMVGGAYGYAIHLLFPDVTASYGAYALVGMAAVFAGTTRATLTAIVMLFEMTQDYAIILPLMFACVVADLLAWKLQKDTIYTKKLVRRGTYIPTDMQVNILDVKTAADVMATDIVTVSPKITVEEFEKSVAPTGHHGFPVVTKGKLVGIITDYDITCCKGIGETGIKVEDLMHENVVTAHPNDSLQSVFENMLTRNISHVPVVDRKNPRKLLGFITKRDVLNVLSKDL